MGKAALSEVMEMDKDNMKRLKQLVDVTIDFLKLVSTYLGEAVATIIAKLPSNGRNDN